MPESYSPAPESEEALYGSYIVRDIWVFYGVGITSALLRIIIRCGVTRRLGPEEALMLLLSIFFTGYIFAVRHYLIHGTNLMTPSERLVVMLNADLIRAHESGSKALVMAWCLYISIIWGCKTTIWIVCRRLTDRAAAQKRRVLYAGWLVVVTYIIAMMTVLTICSPFDGYWQIYPVPGSECTDGYRTLLIVGTVNIISDIPLLAIPVPIVVNLQISWRQKSLLLLLFGVGICVIAAAFGRMIEVTFNAASGPSTFWALIETTCALVVSNIPGIQSGYTYFVNLRKKRAAAIRISAQEYELRTPRRRLRNAESLPPLAGPFAREFSQHRIINSEERVTVRIVSEPLDCELAPEWLSKESGEEVEGELEGTMRGGFSGRVRSLLPMGGTG